MKPDLGPSGRRELSDAVDRAFNTDGVEAVLAQLDGVDVTLDDGREYPARALVHDGARERVEEDLDLRVLAGTVVSAENVEENLDRDAGTGPDSEGEAARLASSAMLDLDDALGRLAVDRTREAVREQVETFLDRYDDLDDDVREAVDGEADRLRSEVSNR